MTEAVDLSRQDSLTGFFSEPVQLQPHRNFYDQYPFKQVFAQAAHVYEGASGQQIEGVDADLAVMLSRVIASMGRVRGGSVEEVDAQTIITRMSAAEILPDRTRRDLYAQEGRFKLMKKIVGGVFRELDGSFDSWRTYVDSKRDKNFYAEAGDYRLSATEEQHAIGVPAQDVMAQTLPPSYLVWQEDFAARARRIERRLIFKDSGTGYSRNIGTVMRMWNIAHVKSFPEGTTPRRR